VQRPDAAAAAAAAQRVTFSTPLFYEEVEFTKRCRSIGGNVQLLTRSSALEENRTSLLIE